MRDDPAFVTKAYAEWEAHEIPRIEALAEEQAEPDSGAKSETVLEEFESLALLKPDASGEEVATPNSTRHNQHS